MFEYQMFKGNWEDIGAKIQQEASEGWRVSGFTTDGATGGFYLIMERQKRKADKRGSAVKSSPR